MCYVLDEQGFRRLKIGFSQIGIHVGHPYDLFTICQAAHTLFILFSVKLFMI